MKCPKCGGKLQGFGSRVYCKDCEYSKGGYEKAIQKGTEDRHGKWNKHPAESKRVKR